MDPATEQVLLGLASNALYDFIVRGLGYSDAGDSHGAAERAVSDAFASLKDVPQITPALGGELCRGFLNSDEAQNIVRQIYASEGRTETVAKAWPQFQKLWEARTGVDDAETLREVHRLFDTLVALCEKSLTKAIANGSISAHEARSVKRHAETLDALGHVQHVLEAMRRVTKVDIDRIDEFAATYRAQVAAREGVLTPPALDTARKIPIDDLYVPARLEIMRPNDSEQIDYHAFSKHLYRAVVLGNPGSGKSTLAKKLATDLASGKAHLSTVGSAIVPFLVVLRDFGSHKKEDPCSILDFISLTSNSRYQIPPPPGAIEYLLATNRAVVIFDGLDELLDTSYRAEISADVESLTTLYPSAPILVTSREVGYSQAPLSDRTFQTLRLTEFVEPDVRRYARNCFGVDTELTAAEADAQADHFMVDSQGVEDIRANALMLGLMCNLYKGSGYIPRNRSDVYEACAEMLFDRWDRLRQIDVGLNIESLLRPTMQHLAFWIYQDPELQSGVTEGALIAEASRYLLNRRFDDQDDAEIEARRFIEFCRGRAWVFTDTGTKPSGQRLYQFTHRTFLEFFAAGHLVRTNPSPGELLKVLEPRIAAKEWDVVAQLAFQLLDRNVDAAGMRLISDLIPEHMNYEDAAEGNRIDFAVRSLQFLVPAPATTRSLTNTAVDRCMAWDVANVDPSERPSRLQPRTERRLNPVETILALTCANPENVSVIGSALEERLLSHLGETLSGNFAAELALNLVRWPLDRNSDLGLANEIFQKVLREGIDQIIEIARGDVGIAQDLVSHDLLSTGELVEHHGLGGFLGERFYPMFPEMTWVSIGAGLLSALLWGDSQGVFSTAQARNALSQLAKPLGVATAPWYQVTFPVTPLWPLSRNEAPSDNRATVEELSPQQRFSLVAILCAYLDEELSSREDLDVNELDLADTIHNPALEATLWPDVSPILLAKTGEGSLDEAIAALNALEIGGKGRETLERWLKNKVSLVDVKMPENYDRETWRIVI